MRTIQLTLVLAAFPLFAGAANALTCHIVLDRHDNVVYRDITPPIDLSDRGDPARAALRQRGEFLLMIEADQCSRFVATTGAAGAGGATVDEIVAGMRGYPGVSGGVTSTPRQGTASATPTAPAPPRAGASSRSY